MALRHRRPVDRRSDARIVPVPRAGVAEWQTRQTQNLLSERTWEFKSPRPHHAERSRLAAGGIAARGSGAFVRLLRPR